MRAVKNYTQHRYLLEKERHEDQIEYERKYGVKIDWKVKVDLESSEDELEKDPEEPMKIMMGKMLPPKSKLS